MQNTYILFKLFFVLQSFKLQKLDAVTQFVYVQFIQ